MLHFKVLLVIFFSSANNGASEMNNNITASQQHSIRVAFENINIVINALMLAEHHSGDDLVASSILLCRRQLAKSIDSLSEQFGADWPENR